MMRLRTCQRLARPVAGPVEQHNRGENNMTDDEVKNLPKTSVLLAREEFVAWIASRKEAGAKIDIGTAELKGWWELEGDPYSLSHWRPKEADWNNYEPPEAIHHISDSREPIPCFFVRGPQSRGWVWLGDLS